MGPATDGNNAVIRVTLEGGGKTGTGIAIGASDSIVRGLNIDGFVVGVSVLPGATGDLIQGNAIGQYRVYPVDISTGSNVLTSSGFHAVSIVGIGNFQQGVLLDSTNTTVGGVEGQDANVIIGNNGPGVAILPGAPGNQIIGNQIGIAGPIDDTGEAIAIIDGNRGDGVLVGDSSNSVGGPASGAGNLISGNGGDGVHIDGPAATRVDVQGNDIGTPAGGNFLFGSSDSGNGGDGVTIEDAADNLIGGAAKADRNVISGNSGAGVRIENPSGVGNVVQGDYIGITADGLSALGNGEAGVLISSADNVVGPTNVISANLQGVLLTGAGATGNLVNGNDIGTDPTGTANLGNAEEGVRIDGASNNSVTGNAQGSQVISGNNVGVLIVGATAIGNQILGNFVGTDLAGKLDLGNSNAGVEVDDAPGNVIGNPSTTGRNVISANHTGVELVGAGASGTFLQNNFIGTDISGTLPLGNEIDGVSIHEGATNNLIGGSSTAAGNTVAFNRRDGVRVEDDSVGNAILTNSIFANVNLGIDLVQPLLPGAVGPNHLEPAPVVSTVATSTASTIITGTLTSLPNTAFTIQLFGGSTLDPTGANEGAVYLGQASVVTDAAGMATYSANVPTLLKSGQFVTATATDPLGNTSEFSKPVNEVFGTVQFQMASYTVSEGVGTATIVATRLGGSGGLFTVAYSTADGSAVAGTNYQAASGTLTFQPGVDSQSFQVTIIDNGEAAADTTVLLNLGAVTGPITLGAQSSAVLTILGNQPGAFQFNSAGYTAGEGAGSATITVVRQSGGTAATVNYSTAPGTAEAGVDYTPVSGTLDFAAGQLSQTFTIPILVNPQIRGNGTAILNLSSPTGGATLASPSSAVLTIIDDGVDRRGPQVTSVVGVAGARGVAEVVISFDEPLNPTTAVDLLNYGYSIRVAGKDGKLGTADDHLIGLRAATYNPTTRTVTLPLAMPIASGTKFLLQINEATDVPGAGVGVSDLLGNLLDGNDDDRPGGSFSAVVVARPLPTPPKSAKKPAAKVKPVKTTTTKAVPKPHSTAKKPAHPK